MHHYRLKYSDGAQLFTAGPPRQCDDPDVAPPCCVLRRLLSEFQGALIQNHTLASKHATSEDLLQLLDTTQGLLTAAPFHPMDAADAADSVQELLTQGLQAILGFAEQGRAGIRCKAYIGRWVAALQEARQEAADVNQGSPGSRAQVQPPALVLEWQQAKMGAITKLVSAAAVLTCSVLWLDAAAPLYMLVPDFFVPAQT